MTSTSWHDAASHLSDSMRTRPLAVATILAVCLFVATLSLLDPYYETNDDAVMNSIAAGQLLTSEPDEHLVFTSVFIGLLLPGTQTVQPGGSRCPRTNCHSSLTSSTSSRSTSIRTVGVTGRSFASVSGWSTIRTDVSGSAGERSEYRYSRLQWTAQKRDQFAASSQDSCMKGRIYRIFEGSVATRR